MIIKVAVILGLMLFNIGCSVFSKADNSDSQAEKVTINKSFNYETTSNIKLEIISSLRSDLIRFQIYKAYSNDEYGNILLNGNDLMGEFVTNSDGKVDITLTLASYFEVVYIKTDYPGMSNELYRVPIENNKIFLDYSNISDQNFIEVELDSSKVSNMINANILDNFSYLIPSESGTLGNNRDELWSDWDYNAVPNKIIKDNSRFSISQNLLDTINQTFPEKSKNVADTVDTKDIATNIRVVEDDTEIWVTFIHEGAGYRNVLGYYTYNKNTPPASIDDIEDITLVFPNVSYQNGGGGLNSGDTVYLGSFPKDTVIGWVVFSNGYNRYGTDRVGERGKVTKGYYQLFSDKKFNPNEVQQMALLDYDDNGEKKLILAYEDILRPGGDQDFNDTVFYVTAEPEVIPDSGEFLSEQNIITEKTIDDNLNVSSRLYFPSKNNTATLAFEDLWPEKGDYDFNDLVVDYNFEELLNSEGNVVEIQAYFKVASYIGAGFTRGNGLAIQLGIEPDDVSEVKFYTDNGFTQEYNPLVLNDYIGKAGSGLRENKVENGTSKAVILISDCIKAGENEGDTYYVNIKFNTAQKRSKVGTPPYNPFIMANGLRGREIHLSTEYSTILGSTAIDLLVAEIVTNNDTEGSNSPFTTVDNLPWVLNIPISFSYPEESIDIRLAYNYFTEWAKSKGNDYKDWYLNLNGYRNNSLLHEQILFSIK